MEDRDLDQDLQIRDNPIVGLLERERRFGEAYFEVALQHGDHNDTLLLAYRRAFPLAENPDRSAIMLARGLMRAPRVQLLITRLREELSLRRLIPAERVSQELERIALANVLDYLTIDPTTGETKIDMRRMTPATAAAVSEVIMDEEFDPRSGTTKRKVKLKFHSKMDALDKLARMHRLYRDMNNSQWTLDDLERLIRHYELQLADRGMTIEHEKVAAE